MSKKKIQQLTVHLQSEGQHLINMTGTEII